MTEKMTIAYAPDNNYTNLTIVSMTSVLVNNRDRDIEFLILYSDLTESNMAKYRAFEADKGCPIRYLQIDENDFSGLPISNWVTIQAWFRVKIPDLCPDLDKVLYLDSDTIVTSRLDELWGIDLGENYLAAVKDICDVSKHLKRLRMKSNSYFNSGVLLINCRMFRQDGVFAQIKEIIREDKFKIKFCDQDTLNLVSDLKKINLPKKYDYMEMWFHNFYYEYGGEDEVSYIEARRAPVIVHLSGLKPTHKGCKHSRFEDWWRYAKLSGVYDELVENYEKSVAKERPNSFFSKIFNVKSEYHDNRKWKVLSLFGVRIKINISKKLSDAKVFFIFNTASIGDILLNNCLVQNIKHFYPQSLVVYVVQPKFEDVARYQRGVDDVLTFDKKKDSNLSGLIRFFKKNPYKKIFASFVIYNNERNLLISRFLGAKHIISYHTGVLGMLFNTYEKFKRPEYVHAKDQSTGLIEALVGTSIKELPIIYEAPFISSEAVEKVRNLSLEKDVVLISTTGNFALKDMPKETAIELVERLLANDKYPVMVGGGQIAKEYSEELKSRGCTGFVDLVGETSFVDLANVLKLSRALITVDTGTLHFANAVGCPTVAVFYAGSEESWAPQDGIYKSITISDNQTVDKIYDALISLNERS